ncbi:hypothetical protein D9M70_567770 [compost metagenome]
MKPSSSGSPDEPRAKEPTPLVAGFSQRIMKAETIRVNMPRMMPLGMSRWGSTDSSAASGSCSMARNSQTANGIAASTPPQPLGRKGPLPCSSSIFSGPTFIAQRAKSRCGMALIQYTTRQARASRVTIRVTLNDSSTPITLSQMNTA